MVEKRPEQNTFQAGDLINLNTDFIINTKIISDEHKHTLLGYFIYSNHGKIEYRVPNGSYKILKINPDGSYMIGVYRGESAIEEGFPNGCFPKDIITVPKEFGKAFEVKQAIH